MDQVKVALNWLKRHHFWVLILLAVIISAVAWKMGSSQLQTEIAANKSAIESQVSSANQIKNKPFHPNDAVNKVQADENVELAAKVRAAWSALYDRQAQEVLKWPAQLGGEFARALEKLDFGDEIVGTLRDKYLNYIQSRFPDLPKIVNAIELPADDAGGGRGGRGGGMMGEFGGEFGGFGGAPGGRLDADSLANQDFLVQWHDQGHVRAELAWDKRPSSLDIWVTQENLWVYETLLRAIADTNKAAGADRYSNAAVRDIFQMVVGKDATKDASSGGRIYVPTDGADGMGGRGEFGMSEFGGEFGGGMSEFGGEMGGGMGEFGGEFGGEGADEKALLLAGRYVDGEGAPMLEATDGEFKYGTEYKRLPVRLVLKLDQRWLNRLMIELANAPLQVEVQEVRINPQTDNQFGEAGGRRGRGAGGLGADGEVLAFNREPNVRDQVVIEGLVYIFYPPDETVLEVQAAGDELAGDF